MPNSTQTGCVVVYLNLEARTEYPVFGTAEHPLSTRVAEAHAANGNARLAQSGDQLRRRFEVRPA
jgi:hypothetical protein